MSSIKADPFIASVLVSGPRTMWMIQYPEGTGRPEYRAFTYPKSGLISIEYLRWVHAGHQKWRGLGGGPKRHIEPVFRQLIMDWIKVRSAERLIAEGVYIPCS